MRCYLMIIFFGPLSAIAKGVLQRPGFAPGSAFVEVLLGGSQRTRQIPFFAALQNDYITALDGVAVTSGPYDAVIYVTSEANVYKGQKESSSTCTASGFDCWQFF